MTTEEPSGSDVMHGELLELLSGKDNSVTPEKFKKLLCSIDNYTIIAKVFLLEGTPYVFNDSPMRYVVFREQVAERFGIGSQDVCIVGSAKLGFSPSSFNNKFGRPFNQDSDVDVVVISEKWFHSGSLEIFNHLNTKRSVEDRKKDHERSKKNEKIEIEARTILIFQEAIRNFVNNNFNPSLLPDANMMKNDIFEKISSTSALFLALKPQVFVSKIRCRFFKSWKAAELYYANSLRTVAKNYKHMQISESDTDPEEESTVAEVIAQTVAEEVGMTAGDKGNE